MKTLCHRRKKLLKKNGTVEIIRSNLRRRLVRKEEQFLNLQRQDKM